MSLSKCFDYSKSEFTGSGRGLGIEDKTINCSGTDAFQNTGDITGKTDLKTEGECVTAQEKKTAPEEKAKGETLMVPSPSVSGASGNTKGDNPEDSQTEIKIENTEENDVTSSTDIVPTTKGEPTESADEPIAHVRSAEEPDSSTGTASDLFAYQASKYSGNLAFNLVDNTLPSSLAESAQENGEQNITGGLVGKTESGTEAQEFNRQDLILPHICQIYNELCVTYQEFQRERSAQEQYALELQRREYFLVQRETLLDRREAALAAIKHAEKEVQARFGIINKQHDTEMNRMKETLRGVAEENSRLKSSFNSVMDENDSLKKQLSDANEQNKKLDDRAKSMQAQLDNLKQPGTEMNRMKETLRGVAEENSKLKSSFKSVTDENDSLKKQLSDANEQNKKLDDRAKSMQAQLDNLKLYMTEMNRMRETLRGVAEENSKLKSSFKSVMDENDSLKKQLSDANEQNKKLDDRAKSMQAQLNDSKQKHALVMTQKSNDSGQVVRSRKRGMEKNETGASKSDKQPDTEMNRMKETLRGVAEENSKLKSSFKSVMDENDSLKKQLSDAKEQNKKLEDRARSMQAQLNDSKQKHALVMTQKSNDSGQVVRSRKRGMEKNETGASKSDKQPDTEMNRMKETLRGVAEENSKLKSSFKSVMDENDSLKKQLSDANEQNKKLDDRAKSMQAQLNDLQQKHALVMAQKSNDSGDGLRSRKRGNEKNEKGASKSDKQPDTEMNRMKETLRGVAEENSKLKSSFKSVMDENDSLKKQLSGMYDYNKKLEDHARSMQAQLNDLQQKHALVMAQMSNYSGGVVFQRKRGNEEKETALSKSAKLYRTEMNRMRDALRGVAQENSRLKSSFTCVMVENDFLKKQLSGMYDYNKKLEDHARSMQAQLNDLQQKHALVMAQMSNDSGGVVFQRKRRNEEKQTALSKSAKLYRTEMNRMRDALRGVAQENSRLKSSFTFVLVENDSLKKQLSDANEQNKKLDDGARSMQARLDNLKLYMTEMNRMRETLRGVAEENSKLKSSFKSVMDENDSLKKQLSDANEQNKKLDDRARSMQAQLNDSKQKHALVMTQKSNDSGEGLRSRKRRKEKNETGASESDKQPDTEMNRMKETLRGVAEENSKLKSSFKSVMDENDSLKKQLSDAKEQNKKLDDRARSMQAQLNDSKQKHALVMAQKSNDSGQVVCQPKPVKEENETGASESDKVLLNSKVYDLLTILMDWISNEHLSKIEIKGEREGNDKPQCAKENCTPENCMKLLSVVTGQLQWMPFVDPKLHMPVIQFIYWSLRQINTGNKHASMTSTMERLGEVIFKGIEHQGNLQTWSEKSTQSTPKTVLFFTSSFMPLRFLSTLILLETAKFQRVNYLTHAFRSLCVDLRTDEGKMLFLQYQCVPVVLSHLNISGKCLLSCALDALTEMARSSDKNCLQLFLEYCSTESVFRACSELLQNPGLDMWFLKKICFLLRKLSEIKSNKKMFESFALPEVIKELLRTTHPDHHHFCVDLRVILYNLGVAESNSARLASK